MKTSGVLVDSAVGPWGVIGDQTGLLRIAMPYELPVATAGPVPRDVTSVARQLERYFAGTLRHFDVNFAAVVATTFQHSCWEALQAIPYGAVATYAEIARAIGRPRAARAVGNANHANPWPIVIPCHRVIASNGLGGYGGGTAVKEYLLALEGFENPYTK